MSNCSRRAISWMWAFRCRLRWALLGLTLLALSGISAPARAEDETKPNRRADILSAVKNAEDEAVLQRIVEECTTTRDAVGSGLLEIAEADKHPLRIAAIRMLGQVRVEDGLVWCARNVRLTFPQLAIHSSLVRESYLPAAVLERAGWCGIGAILRAVTDGETPEEHLPFLADIMVGVAGHEAASAIVLGRLRGAPRLAPSARRNVENLRQAVEDLGRGRLVWPPPPAPKPLGPPDRGGEPKTPSVGTDR